MLYSFKKKTEEAKLLTIIISSLARRMPYQHSNCTSKSVESETLVMLKEKLFILKAVGYLSHRYSVHHADCRGFSDVYIGRTGNGRTLATLNKAILLFQHITYQLRDRNSCSLF
jgi:hypothetical protein